MTRGELIEMVTGEITASGSLPYSIPERESNRIIDQALNWFWVNYGPAVETQFYVIQKDWFKDGDSVGICGATSTPQWQMNEVKETILSL